MCYTCMEIKYLCDVCRSFYGDCELIELWRIPPERVPKGQSESQSLRQKDKELLKPNKIGPFVCVKTALLQSFYFYIILRRIQI